MSPIKHASEFNRFINLIRLLESLVVALRNFITLYYESFTSVFTVRLIIRKILWAQLASSNDYATGKKELYIPRRNCSMEKGIWYPTARSTDCMFLFASTVLLYFYPVLEYYAIISARNAIRITKCVTFLWIYMKIFIREKTKFITTLLYAYLLHRFLI